MKSRFQIGAIVVVAVAAGHCVATADVALKVMPLGDSITEGWMASMIGHPENDIAGYRGPLYAKLTVAGYDVQFVGSNNTFPGTLPAGQIHHEGHSGWMIAAGMAGTESREGLTEHIEEWLGPEGVNPDVILLMIGTNDIWWNNQLDTAPDRLSTLISKISNKTTGLKPDAHLIVAQVTPFDDNTKDALVQTYNSSMANVVLQHRAWGENVSLVDMHSAVSRTTDLSDLVHPNANGYNKIADVWLQGIKTAVAPEPSTIVLLPSGAIALLVLIGLRSRIALSSARGFKIQEKLTCR